MVSLPMSTPNPSDGDSVTISTGETVELPLSTDATITGAVLPASREGVGDLLPDGLVPVGAGPGRAAVTFLCVEYHRVGRLGEFEPYDEFGVLLPAVPEATRTVPYLSAFTRGVGGYVWYLPVTTEPARALGVEVWGYPKEVAEITHEERDGRRRTTVDVDGQRLVTIEVDRPPMVTRSESSTSYTERDGELLREELSLSGEIGGWPLSGSVRVSVGSGSRADRLRSLDLGGRALLRFAAEAEFVVHAGKSVPRGGCR